MEKRISSPRRLSGSITVPPDKSISHRAAVLNAIASGPAVVENFLVAEDCLSTLACLRSLGVSWSLRENHDGGSDLTITGRGLAGLSESADVLDAGNSGTTMRLLAGLLAGRPFLSIITGDDSLRSRPMARIVEPLRQMGAQVYGRDSDTLAPLVIMGRRLRGIRYRSPVASAQVKSALLLAGLQAEGETLYEEPVRSRDHTERMLRAMGAGLREENNALRLSPLAKDLAPLSLRVPGDFSAAAFWLVAAALHPDADLTLRGVGLNPTRSGLLDVLKEMGADIVVSEERIVGGEPVADLRARSGKLRGVEVDGPAVVRLIDEVPVLAVAASLAEGRTMVRDVGELRLKESDRVKLLVHELRRMGARIDEEGDALVIEGTDRFTGAVCDSHGDHRLAMALAVAGVVAEGETVIRGAEASDVSYPGFWQVLDSVKGTS
ncbi:MAG: 3-phosphoshikimate 1-carboxyvinyltransferase [Dehalococcoidia bacterium]|nr:3-phosphoshikimate 1-carboxyvinyltransferase [Dehalococcoidia bacterium]